MAATGATIRMTVSSPASSLPPPRQRGSPLLTRAFAFILSLFVCSNVSVVFFVGANPYSKPYIAYRTSPYDQEGVMHHSLTGDDGDSKLEKVDPQRGHKSQVFPYHPAMDSNNNAASKLKTSHNPLCPLQLSIGVSKRLHGDNAHADAIRSPPIVHPLFPSLGPGRQVLVSTIYEHLDLFSPAFFATAASASYVKEILVQAPEFPLLLESSSFLTSPILTHVPAGDQSHPAVVLSDYDGGVYVVGLTPGSNGNDKKAGGHHHRRYFHKAQVPRLFVRREWTERRVHQELTAQGLAPAEEEKKLEKEVVEGGSEKKSKKEGPKPDDPFHSYFEYYYADESGDGKEILRGVSANVLGQDHSQLQGLAKRRARKHKNMPNRTVRDADRGDRGERGEEEGGSSREDDEPQMDDLERDQLREWKERMGRAKIDDDDYAMEGMQYLEDDEVAKAALDHHAKEKEARKEREKEKQQQEGGAADNAQQNQQAGDGAAETMRRRLQAVVGGALQTSVGGAIMRRRLQAADGGAEQQQQQQQENPGQQDQNHQQQQQQQDPGAAAGAAVAADAANQQQQQQEVPPQGEVHQDQQQQQQQQQDPGAAAGAAVAADAANQQQQEVPPQGEVHQDQQQQQQQVADEQRKAQQAQQQEAEKTQQQQQQAQQDPGQAGGAAQEAPPDAAKQQQEVVQPDQPQQQQQQEENVVREQQQEAIKREEEIQHEDRNQDVHGGEAGAHHGGEQERHAEEQEKNWYDDFADREADYDGTGDDFAGEGSGDNYDGEGGAAAGGDDIYAGEEEVKYDDVAMDDPEYGVGGVKYDDEGGHRGDYDDYYGGRNREHEEYYDGKHYFRIPPHILCAPVLAEVPKQYSNDNEKEDILLVAASYYLDEDEYEGLFSYKRYEKGDHGDETEVLRGTYVASAIMVYVLGDSPRWSGHIHLDLSTDYSSPENATLMGQLPIRKDLSKMGAFALGSPSVADIDGDGNYEVLVGTSMGIIYCFDARQMYKKDNWPVQMKRPIESRILIEDVHGDTNLEVFAADVSANIVCLDHKAQPIWSRSLSSSLGYNEEDISRLSEMTLGDVNGDGVLDLVVAVRVRDRSFLFALNAATGTDLDHFPVELERQILGGHDHTANQLKLTQPLLVNLHADQSFLSDYIRRNGTAWSPRGAGTPKSGAAPPHGGSAPGLHIVYPQAETLYIVEGGSGCTQTISIGDTVSAMVQVDDVHGTNRLDLVVSTESGDIITLESASPYHPLNTWNKGELRGRMNGHSHGYSASQGIFVHEMSRQYTDIFGVYVPITFEIFDNRPNIQNEPDKRKYTVEVRAGTSSKRALLRAEYNQPGVYTERVYVRFGPGYYSLSVVLLTTHGLFYEDTFHIGYNVHFMSGFSVLLWLPLLVASATIFFCGVKKTSWDDQEEDADPDSSVSPRGILGRNLPS